MSQIYKGDFIISKNTPNHPIPEDCEALDGNLVLINCTPDLAPLPFCVITGHVQIVDSVVSSPCPRLRVLGGSLMMQNATVCRLDGLEKIMGGLDMISSQVVHLGRLQKIEKHLRLRHSEIIHAHNLKEIFGPASLKNSTLVHFHSLENILGSVAIMDSRVIHAPNFKSEKLEDALSAKTKVFTKQDLTLEK